MKLKRDLFKLILDYIIMYTSKDIYIKMFGRYSIFVVFILQRTIMGKNAIRLLVLTPT